MIVTKVYPHHISVAGVHSYPYHSPMIGPYITLATVFADISDYVGKTATPIATSLYSI